MYTIVYCTCPRELLPSGRMGEWAHGPLVILSHSARQHRKGITLEEKNGWSVEEDSIAQL